MGIPRQRILVGLLATLTGIAVGAFVGYMLGRAATLGQTGLRLDQFAQRNITHGDLSTAESRQILAQMNASPFAYCSEAEVAFFRKLVFQSQFIKEAGRMRSGTIDCSSTLGRATGIVTQVRPDFTQKDGTLVYRNLPMFRMGKSTVITVQLGDSYIVYSPFDVQSLGSGSMHYIVTDTDAQTNSTGRLVGDSPHVPAALLTHEGQTLQNGSMYATRCSADGMVCTTTFISIPEALRVNRGVRVLFVLMGTVAGGLLGFVCSLVYRRKKGMEPQLLRALRRDALRVVYQPIVDLRSEQIVEAEALVRWTDEDGHTVSPDVFVKVAEQGGFVGGITRLVVRRVLRDFGQIMRERTGFRVNVNIAAADLADSTFLPMLETALAEAGVEPRSLGIEITESGTARHQVAKETILRLRQKGHFVHIDDFGTGYSSLAYLHDLAVDAIKIDKAFTKAIGTDAVTVSILPQILTMAQTLGLRVIVEGIETPEQARYFAAVNQSIYAQGWLYGYPTSADAFQQMLTMAASKKGSAETFNEADAVHAAASAA
jgi:sensor c-di-GMP phosphodiesterase-like protein